MCDQRGVYQNGGQKKKGSREGIERAGDQNKQSLAIGTADELLDLRKQLQSIINLKAQRILFLKKRFFSLNIVIKLENS